MITRILSRLPDCTSTGDERISSVAVQEHFCGDNEYHEGFRSERKGNAPGDDNQTNASASLVCRESTCALEIFSLVSFSADDSFVLSCLFEHIASSDAHEHESTGETLSLLDHWPVVDVKRTRTYNRACCFFSFAVDHCRARSSCLLLSSEVITQRGQT